MSQIQITKLNDWLRSTLAPRISQAERERDKLLSEIKKATEALPEYCNQLSKKAEQDMEMKRENRAQYKAAKALSKLTTIVAEICKSINIPQEKSSIELRNLQRGLQKAASEGARVRTEYLRHIRPFYIIDMMSFGGNIDKLRRLSEELHTFLMGHGTLLRSLEELDEKMKTIEKLQTSRDTISAQKESTEQQLSEAQITETRLREELGRIRQNKKMKEYVQIDKNLRTIRKELLRTGFSRLGRPLRKLASISARGEYPVSAEIRQYLNEYLTKPFSTFLREAEGYPRLKALMTTLSDAVSSSKLALKQRETKKVLDRSEQIISGNSLTRIQTEAGRLKAEYDRCLLDEETASLVRQLKDLKENGRTNSSHQKGLKAELQKALESEKKANEQISSMMREIEEFCSKLAGEEVRIKSA
jgi:hypothetical protein